MPEGYTHIRTARRAAHAIHYKPQCPDAFAAGANGPDIFFCYQAWKKAAARTYDLPELGRRMHEEDTGAFLLSLIRHTRTQAQIEYTLGFLCHYAADTVLHPYVVFVSGPGQPYARRGGHGYFEIALDSTLHAEDTGRKEVFANDASPMPVGTALADIAVLLHTCIREVYGLDVSVEALADAFYCTNRLRGIFVSRFGVRRAFYWLVESFFGGRGFLTGHVSPAKLKLNLPEDWSDPATGAAHHGTVFDLLQDAQHRCELFMTAALGSWLGRLEPGVLERTLGSMSYTTGQPIGEPPAPAPAEAPQAPTDAAPAGEVPDAEPAEPQAAVEPAAVGS